MKKQEYLAALAKELKQLHVADSEEIIAEYEQHFAYKMADGYSEEEITAKLESPTTLAAQFVGNSKNSRQSGGGIKRLGLVFADIGSVLFFIIIYAWLVVLAAFTIAVAVAGVCLILSINIYGLLPAMPYFSALIVGLGLLALAVAAAMGSYYYLLFARQLVRKYLRWHKNVLSNKLELPLPLTPDIPGKTRRRMRSIGMMALVIFGGLFIIGLAVMCIQAGTFEFWHAWQWFV